MDLLQIKTTWGIPVVKYFLSQRWHIFYNFMKILIGSHPLIEEISLICGRRGYHSVNLDTEEILFAKSEPLEVYIYNGYFTADDAWLYAFGTFRS